MRIAKSHLANAIQFALAAAAGLSIANTALAQEEPMMLEEVTVTAQKREEALADIPMSITLLTGEVLEKQQVLNFKDMVPLVAGLSITGDTPGITRITLRGINTGGVASTVGVYLDNVPFGSSSGLANGSVLSADFDTFDMSRVEVLRGPQGTLYGASSLGGVIKYVPNKPSTEGFEGRVKGSLETVDDGGTGYAVTGVVNIPLGETFALRASGFHRYDDGFIDSIGNNPVPTLTDPTQNVIEGTQQRKNINEHETSGGRLSALWEPNEKFSINLTAMTQKIESDAPTNVDANPLTFKPLDGMVQSRYQDSWTDISYDIVSADIDWDLGFASFQSITSSADFEQDFQNDLAIAAGLTGGTPLSALITFLFDDPTTPEIAPKLSSVMPQITATDKITQEFRLVSPSHDTFEWLLGFYYTDEDSVIDQEILAVNAGTEDLASGIPSLATARVTSNYEEKAFFGNATWHVSDRFDLSFGLRSSSNDQQATQFTDGPLAGGAPATIAGESSESPLTWSFSPRWELNENSSIYFRAATGFRPGGPNILPPGAPPGTPASYDSDELTSYEAGYKMYSSDGRFAFDITAFYLDWEDIQLFAVVNGFGVNTNGGTAVSKGIEFSSSFMPTDNLRLSFNGAYSDAYLTQDTSDIVGGFDGDALPYVPNWSFGISADYDWAIGDRSNAYVGGTLGYTGDRPVGYDQRLPGGNLNELGAYSTLDLRTGLEFDRWAFELYVRNLTNEAGGLSVGSDNTIATGWVDLGVLRPRTIGVSVAARF